MIGRTEVCLGQNKVVIFGTLRSLVLCHQSIRASVDALCRDDTSKISRYPGKKRLLTWRERL